MRHIYKHCVILGIDGMGNFNRSAKTPNMDALFENGAKTFFGLSMEPTISAENWGAMLLGATPVVHGLTNSIVGSKEYTNKALPSIFTRLRIERPDAYFASVVNWNPINHGIIEHNVGVDLKTNDSDDLLTDNIVAVLDKKPELLFVQFDDCDGAGHGHGYGSPEHIAQIEKTDCFIGRITDKMKQVGMFDDSLVIVIADHGGIRRGHGGNTDEEMFVFFGISGKTVAKTEIKAAKTVDVAAIALYALGADVPAYDKHGFSSQIPEGVFPEYTVPYYVPEIRQNLVKTNAAKPADADNGLFSFFDKDDIRLAMFFENEIRDETGKCSFEEHGRIKYYSNGVSGFCAEFGKTGAASTNDLSVGDGDFSVAVWLPVDKGINEECVVCTNKDWWWQNRKDRGFALLLKSTSTVFALDSGRDEFALVTPFPEGVKDGWIHTVAVCRKKEKRIDIYYNFEFVRSFDIDEEFSGSSDSEKGYAFTVGDDALFRNNTEFFPNIFRCDDLIVFGRALGARDVKKLGLYYDC